jgi:hypothetical protein
MHSTLIPELADRPHLEVPSPVDVTLFKPVEGVERKPNTVLWVGPFTEYVGIKYALAYTQAKKQYEYTFVGDDAGGLEQPWKEKIQALGFKVLPYMPNEALPSLYSSFEYFIQLPSGPMPCMDGKVKIASADGFTPIRLIKTGDMVWTHQGRLRKVTKVSKRTYFGKVIKIVLAVSTRKRFRAISLTPEHPVLTDKRGWVKAEELSVNDRLICLASRCQVCGKPIFFDNKYCSSRCNLKAAHPQLLIKEYKRMLEKHQKFPPLKISDLELGRLVGMIDGEGSIYIKEDKRDRMFYLEMHVSSSDRNVLQHMKDVTGIGSVYKAIDKTRPSYCKELYRWQIGSEVEIRVLLQAIKDHLIIKKRQAELILKLLDYKLKLYQNRITREQFEREKAICRAKIITMNKRTWTNRNAIDRLIESHSTDGGIIEFVPIKIRKIETKPLKREKVVYNLEIDEDNSYIASAIVVHNCQRVAIEAYLCGCKIIANRNLGFASWNFKDREECRKAVSQSPRKFWEAVEKAVETT